MQRYRLRAVSTATQPHGRPAKAPKDHVTLLLDQVGSHGTALLVEMPQPYVTREDAPLFEEPVAERNRRADQIERALAVWLVLRGIAYRKTYVDVYPVSADMVTLEVWSTSYGGACNLGESSFHARFEDIQLAWPCVQTPTHSMEAVPFVETRWNRIQEDADLSPRINFWQHAAD